LTYKFSAFVTAK